MHKISSASQLILKRLQKVFPVLKEDNRKGDNGRIGVIGGSFEFSGAPYYSAISSLKVGGDLAHIFCSKSSSSSIKSYSP
jgi:ATP-dependent NAD(P)H-hydrate dehydratase